MGELEFAGELVIDWPDTGGEFRDPLPARCTALYEFRMGYGLELLPDVIAVTVRASAENSLITAEVTRRRLTGDPDEPFADETSTWLVVGFRMGLKVPARRPLT